MLGNEESDRLAKEVAMKEDADDLDLEIPDSFNIQGAKLAALTQAVAYRGVMETKPRPPRPGCSENLTMAKEAVEAGNGTKETDESIWTSIRNPTIRIRVRQFLYKTMHQAYMIGHVWSGIQGYETRAICETCNVVESMEHILLECRANAPRTNWKRAKETWPHGQRLWPNISLGTILGIGCINLPPDRPPQDNDRPKHTTKEKGRSRLLQILISEASHLIWTLRCEHSIQQQRHTRREIKGRWTKAISHRISTDKIIATKIKRDPKFTSLVEATWSKVTQ